MSFQRIRRLVEARRESPLIFDSFDMNGLELAKNQKNSGAYKNSPEKGPSKIKSNKNGEQQVLFHAHSRKLSADTSVTA